MSLLDSAHAAVKSAVQSDVKCCKLNMHMSLVVRHAPARVTREHAVVPARITVDESADSWEEY